jgi:hypothetical protein
VNAPELALILGPVALAAVIAAVLGWFFRARDRRASAFETAEHVAAFERAAAQYRVQLPRGEVLRLGGRANTIATLRLLVVFAAVVVAPALLVAVGAAPRGMGDWIAALAALLSLAPVAFWVGTLRQLRMWPLARSFVFVAPGKGLVLLGPTRFFRGGVIQAYTGTTFIENPGGLSGIGAVEYTWRRNGAARRSEELLFTWPSSVQAEARAAITALLVGASAPEVRFGLRLDPERPQPGPRGLFPPPRRPSRNGAIVAGAAAASVFAMLGVMVLVGALGGPGPAERSTVVLGVVLLAIATPFLSALAVTLIRR